MNLTEANDFMTKSWGKWPHMFVSGEAISPALALEIVRRTDSFFDYPFGNNKNYIDKWRSKFLIPEYYDPVLYGDYNNYCKIIDRWKNKWKFISLSYAHNDWVSSCHVIGAHGWANPDGTIYQSNSIGKWPSLDEVDLEWSLVAEAFAFLKLSITFFPEESFKCKEPIISLKVEHGRLNWLEPNLSIHSDEALIKFRKEVKEDRIENGLDDKVMEAFAKHAKELFR